MPNWCSNTLRLTHEDPKMIARASSALAKGEFFAEFVPIPEYEKDNWYAFCVREWGTKWDTEAHSVDTDPAYPDTLDAVFDTAWSPPISFYQKMEKMGFTVEARYYEPGMCFAGVYEDGIDSFWDLSGMSSDEVKDVIPEKLDEEFGIVETMQNYEEENDE